MLIDTPQLDRRERLLLMEVEHRRRAIVRRGIVCGAGERCGAVCERHALAAGVFERFEFGKPSGQNRAKPTPVRHAQEAVALAELAVLVAAAGDERTVQSHR